MPKITTCGRAPKLFSYRGNCDSGVIIEFPSGDFVIGSRIIEELTNYFQGQSVYGGFSMTEPTPGGVGEYLRNLGNSLTPRHASFLCAILQHEGLATCTLQGNAVIVSFPKKSPILLGSIEI